jgi:hypothetical protein
MNDLTIGDFDQQIEAIAKDIELLQSAAIIRIAERLAEARELFRYKRNGEGFVEWAETRLKFSKSTAYRLLDVHEKFRDECFPKWETLPRAALYLLAAPSTPAEVHEQVIERSQNGETFTHGQIKKLIAEALAEARERHEAELAKLRQRYEAEAEELRADVGDGLSPGEVSTAIDEALAPLKAKIKRLEEEKEKRKASSPTYKDEHGLKATAIATHLEFLSHSLVITPEQMLEHFGLVARATNQLTEFWARSSRAPAAPKRGSTGSSNKRESHERPQSLDDHQTNCFRGPQSRLLRRKASRHDRDCRLYRRRDRNDPQRNIAQ